MMYDICLIFTPVSELQEDHLEPPLGLMYIAAWLRKHGYDAVICDLSGKEESEREIPEAGIYGFSTYSTTYHRTLEIKERLPDSSMTIAGGPHASALPRDVVHDFDYVVVGEGEAAVLDILDNKCDTGIIYGSPVLDLDSIPYIDYGLVDVSSYKRIVDGKPSFSILSSRGCPYKCLFCNSVIMGAHKPVRFRSPQNVVAEMRCLIEQYDDIAFRFQDDIFASNITWLRKFTRLVKPMGVTYRAFVRTNQCANPEFANLLVQGGCKHVAIGIESGSDKILSGMCKGQTVDIAERAISNAKAAGLIVRIYLIIGFPGETWQTIQETIDFVSRTRPDEFVAYPLIPYPGTPLWDDPEGCGLKNIDPDFTKYFQICGDRHNEFVYDLEDVDRTELTAMKNHVVKNLEAMRLSWAKDSRGYI